MPNPDDVITELSSVFRIPAPDYDYDPSLCGGAIACFDPSGYRIHFSMQNPDPGVVAHEVGHAAHSYYGIQAGTHEYETFAQFTEQLYRGWKQSLKYGNGVTPQAMEPRLLGCGVCHRYSVPNIYPYTRCVSCGQGYSYTSDTTTTSGSTTSTGCQPNIPLALFLGTVGGIAVSALGGFIPVHNREDVDRTIEISLITNLFTVMASLI